MCKKILKTETKSKHWIQFVLDKMRMYCIPDPEILLNRRAPTKQSWKRYIDVKVGKYWSRWAKTEMINSSFYDRIPVLDMKVTGKIHKNFDNVKHRDQNEGARLLFKHQTGEYGNNWSKKRYHHSKSELCQIC